MRGLFFAAATLAAMACVTSRPDVVADGDLRIDEGGKADADVKKAEAAGRCGPDAKGDVVLLDGRTGGPLTCALVTVSMSQETCPSECPTEVLFQGRTNRRGQFAPARPFSHVRLEAVSEGFGTGRLGNASLASGRVLEVEMPPDEGFWLKIVDADGNYVQDTLVTFKSSGDVLAQLRSNVLANVFFTQRNPFSGDSIRVEVEGYQPTLITGAGELGDDGHTLTLKK